MRVAKPSISMESFTPTRRPSPPRSNTCANAKSVLIGPHHSKCRAQSSCKVVAAVAEAASAEMVAPVLTYSYSPQGSFGLGLHRGHSVIRHRHRADSGRPGRRDCADAAGHSVDFWGHLVD